MLGLQTGNVCVLMKTPCGRDLFFPTAGGEDDGAGQGEYERQEGWCPVAALRQLHLVIGDPPFSFHSRAGRRMRMNYGYLSFPERGGIVIY